MDEMSANSTEETEEKEAVSDQMKTDENEPLPSTNLTQPQNEHVKNAEGVSRERNKDDGEKNNHIDQNISFEAETSKGETREEKASGSRKRSNKKKRKRGLGINISDDGDTDDENDSSDCSDSISTIPDDADFLQSTDDSDDLDDNKTSEPKTLDSLGITLSVSNRSWRSYKDLSARQLGIICPQLFGRNVTGSVNMVQRFNLEKKLEYHTGCVNTLNFNCAGDVLASGSDDLKVVLWDWAVGKKKFYYESGHTGNVFQAKFMPNTNDSIVVTCARDGQVRVGYLSSLGSCYRTKRLVQHRDGAHKLSIEPGSPNVFLTCGEDGQVIEIDLRMEGGYRRLLCRGEKTQKVPLYSIFINPAKPEEFAVGGRDYRCRVYDRRHLKEDIKEKIQAVKEYCPGHFEQKDNHTNITCLVYSHDGSELLVSYNDEDIYLFNTSHSSNAEHIHRYKGHRNNITVKGVNFFGPKSEFVVSGSDCGHVFLWDKETESIVQLLHGDDAGVVNCLEPHPHYPILATSGLDHDVKIWTPTSHESVDFEKIKSVVLANDREREDERRRPHYPFDSDLLMFMVNHMARRRVHTTESDAEDGNDDEDSSSEEYGERVQCYPS